MRNHATTIDLSSLKLTEAYAAYLGDLQEGAVPAITARKRLVARVAVKLATTILTQVLGSRIRL